MRAVEVSEKMNEALGLLDKAAALMVDLHATETNEHNKRLLAGMYGGINAERDYVAEYERANRELLPHFVPEDGQPQFVPKES